MLRKFIEPCLLLSFVFIVACSESASAQTFDEIEIVASDGQRLKIQAPTGMSGTPTITLPGAASTIIGMSGTPNDGDVLTYNGTSGSWEAGTGGTSTPTGSIVNFTDNTARAGYTYAGSTTIPGDNDWIAKASLPTAAQGSAATVDGKIYFFSGTNTYEYDPIANSWTTKPIASYNVGTPFTAVVDDKIYAFNGDQVYEYDPATDTWDQKTDAPHQSGIPAALDEKIYYTGGGLGPYSSSVAMFDPATDNWTTGLASLSQARGMHSAVGINGKLYILGGVIIDVNFGLEWTTSSVEVYDPSTDTWTVGHEMPRSVSHLGGIVLDDKIYTFGGKHITIDQNLEFKSNGETYDPATDTWTTLADMATVRYLFGLAAANGKLYAIGGHNGSNNLSSVEEYNPSTTLYYFVKN